VKTREIDGGGQPRRPAAHDQAIYSPCRHWASTVRGTRLFRARRPEPLRA
jgi:hypothetical protein